MQKFGRKYAREKLIGEIERLLKWYKEKGIQDLHFDKSKFRINIDYQCGMYIFTYKGELVKVKGEPAHQPTNEHNLFYYHCVEYVVKYLLQPYKDKETKTKAKAR